MFFATPVRHTAYVPSLRAIDRSLERFLTQGLASARPVHVEQDDKAYTLQIDLPGLCKEHIALEIENTVVRISSKEDAPRQVKLAYEVGQEIDTANSKANLENGVLTLNLAKVVPVSRVVHLAIE
ncbi:MAG: Hsp20/alpha crystallin family protein [Burkholderiales bacterium]